MDAYVERAECTERHAELAERLNAGEVKFARIETQLNSLLAVNKLVGTAIVGGIVTIITILLTRGI